ncbi:NAD(+) diphosphatase [Corynebacterium gerontici]|uniref:NAD(+) diphosphatase n=1 Tax=Corynebacterium gerontici TaxID=2079234 RepID=A0A3G6IYN4_9CORY|nr:NUDIX domain-containing protein [Corynebacterium gerontici]AZA10895.1 NADH pyrophosphatase [Corynebacterium gerontici]
MSTWLVGPLGELPIDSKGQPVALDEGNGIRRASSEEVLAVTGSAARCFDPQSLKIVALLNAQEQQRFHPGSGQRLSAHPDKPGVARSADGQLYFPRIDPAVIGRVQLAGTDKILLGRNAQRSSYFSLIAGYVDLGETFEAAFTREVMEEAGRRIQQVQYLCSQPWPFSSSIMVGMHAVTHDEHPVASTDGELIETRWCSKKTLRSGEIALPAKGSIALRLIQEWCQ